MSTTVTHNVTHSFERGMSLGKRRVFRAGLTIGEGELYFLPGEEGVIEVIQNLIYTALEGRLTEEQLHQDAGIVVGYAATHPNAF